MVDSGGHLRIYEVRREFDPKMYRYRRPADTNYR
jgi:hypothetical protein